MDDKFSFNVKQERPEESHTNVMEYFKGETLQNYALSKNMMKIQWKLTERALELADLKRKDSLILDAGCGPGFASFYLRSQGYRTIAIDLIKEFFQFYEIHDINPIVGDITYIPLRDDSFDAIISISALQWIYREISNIQQRESIIRLLESFFLILKKKSKIVLQYYPKNSLIMDNLKDIIKNYTHFDGHFVIDNPNYPKKRRIFLLLFKEQ